MKDFQAPYSVLLFNKILTYGNFLQYNSNHLNIFCILHESPFSLLIISKLKRYQMLNFLISSIYANG